MRSQLRWTKADIKLISSVRNLKLVHAEWKTDIQEIISYRARLLELQNSRCAYCLGPIESNANGHLELDHILPKLARGTDPKKMVSNLFDDRWVTKGYANFTYEPKNLVIACRACNTAKGTFDPLKERAVDITKYPTGATVNKLITWYHPHFHEYARHIERTPEWTFLKCSDEGDFTIRACKLDILAELDKRFRARAVANMNHSPTVKDALYAIVSSIRSQRYGVEQAIFALQESCQLSRSEAKQLLECWINHVTSNDSIFFNKAIEALRTYPSRHQN